MCGARHILGKMKTIHDTDKGPGKEVRVIASTITNPDSFIVED